MYSLLSYNSFVEKIQTHPFWSASECRLSEVWRGEMQGRQLEPRHPLFDTPWHFRYHCCSRQRRTSLQEQNTFQTNVTFEKIILIEVENNLLKFTTTSRGESFNFIHISFNNKFFIHCRERI